MTPYALTSTVGLKLGPLVLETLVKHYFERMRNFNSEDEHSNLRQDELLYDQAFNIIKAFMTTAVKHTVEELQEFSNVRTPSPPWVRVVRLTVPMSCCDEAAGYLVEALGGEEATKRIVGGTKWWQVRGLKGVSAQWITAKKDWKEAKQRHKAMGKDKGATISGAATADSDDNGTYQPEMDEQRCILYLHGGGYYFGSVDQERYSIQRFARKINGRVFAIDYRLCPQYPFPCAIQDAVASYLYLIRPSPEALHRPVKPEHIVVMGDSAGGGLSLALLQVIRDAGLPAPAGGVLISPWCDMAHSFPSIHQNTTTDVTPFYGLSMHKPSTLWPPPPEMITKRVHTTLRSRIRTVVQLDKAGRLRRSSQDTSISNDDLSSSAQEHGASSTPIDQGDTTQPSHVVNQRLTAKAKSGEILTVDNQVQFYAPNNLLAHPLVSSVGAFLGGLPPLFFIAGDKEVLRDEVIYTAHKAADPDKYPLKDEVKSLNPVLNDIQSQNYGSTRVHLQVYDDCPHVLPVLFAFTTPAKYCFRAIAVFCKHVTAMNKIAHTTSTPTTPVVSILGGPITATPESVLTLDEDPTSQDETVPDLTARRSKRRKAPNYDSLKFPWSLNGKTRSGLSRSNLKFSVEGQNTVDVAGPRFARKKIPVSDSLCAGGNPFMYVEPFRDGVMIRERVSIRGLIRSLEPDSELSAFQIAPADVGAIPELSIKRYLDGKTKYDRKFASTVKTINKQREKNFRLAKKEGVRNLSRLKSYLVKVEENGEKEPADEKKELSDSWNWAWALDDDERPPPSSIVSRRDTSEARKLAEIADLMSDGAMSGNNLWSHLVTLFTVTPDKNAADTVKRSKSDTHIDDKAKTTATAASYHDNKVPSRSKSIFYSVGRSSARN